MPNYRNDPYRPRAPVCNDGTKTCTGECGAELPATSDYFDRDESKADGLRAVCKACRSREREKLEQRAIDSTVKKLDDVARNLIESLGRDGTHIPHAADLYQCLMEAFGGAGGFAQHFMAQYLMAKPGSTTRTKMLEDTIRLGAQVTAMGAAQIPADAMQDEDLLVVYEKGASRMLRLSHDDGTSARAS